MIMRIRLWTLILLAVSLAACSPRADIAPTPNVDVVGTAVAAALTALPPPPAPTAYPTYTPYPTTDLSGLFCEYDFCAGHPEGIPFFDLEVVNDYTTNRSSYAQGNLIAFSENLYVFLAWSQQVGEFDPSLMLNLVLRGDATQEIGFTEDINGRQVSYIWLTTTASADVVPFGLAAAWRCGDRAFGWKVYTSLEDQGLEYLWQALSRFECK